jgi:hypothetical protein
MGYGGTRSNTYLQNVSALISCLTLSFSSSDWVSVKSSWGRGVCTTIATVAPTIAWTCDGINIILFSSRKTVSGKKRLEFG